MTVAAPEIDSYLGACVLQCVLHQVRDDLREPLGIRLDVDGIALHPVEADTPLTCRRGEPVDGCVDHRAGVDAPRVEGELARIETSEVEQVGDEPLQSPRLGEDDARGTRAIRR